MSMTYKLTIKECDEIIYARKNSRDELNRAIPDRTVKLLAKKYNVSITTISAVTSGRYGLLK